MTNDDLSGNPPSSDEKTAKKPQPRSLMAIGLDTLKAVGVFLVDIVLLPFKALGKTIKFGMTEQIRKTEENKAAGEGVSIADRALSKISTTILSAPNILKSSFGWVKNKAVSAKNKAVSVKNNISNYFADDNEPYTPPATPKQTRSSPNSPTVSPSPSPPNPSRRSMEMNK